MNCKALALFAVCDFADFEAFALEAQELVRARTAKLWVLCPGPWQGGIQDHMGSTTCCESWVSLAVVGSILFLSASLTVTRASSSEHSTPTFHQDSPSTKPDSDPTDRTYVPDVTPINLDCHPLSSTIPTPLAWGFRSPAALRQPVRVSLRQTKSAQQTALRLAYTPMPCS